MRVSTAEHVDPRRLLARPPSGNHGGQHSDADDRRGLPLDEPHEPGTRKGGLPTILKRLAQGVGGLALGEALRRRGAKPWPPVCSPVRFVPEFRSGSAPH